MCRHYIYMASESVPYTEASFIQSVEVPLYIVRYTMICADSRVSVPQYVSLRYWTMSESEAWC